MTDNPDATETVQIDWTRAVAGALAAVASAVLLSTLGAAGTIIGAAIGSLVVSVSSAWIAQGLSTSKRSLTKKQKGAAEKMGVAHAEVLRATRADDTASQESHLDHAEERLEEAQQELDEAIVAAAPIRWRERLSQLPWKRVLLVTVGLFVVTLVVITALELVVGRSISSMTGGSGSGDTTIGQVSGHGSGGDDQKDPDQGPTGSTSPSGTSEPSNEPTDSASPSQGQEPTPTDSASAAVSTAPPGSTAPPPAETTSP
jgi:hypothetical protein